jgi:hypothetical protein
MGIIERIEPLPSPLSGSGFLVTGNNLSDDLFLFIKGRITGLRPNRQYAVTFSVTFATQALAIGGDSMYVKAGAADIEPSRQVLTVNGVPYFVMNVDKGSAGRGGTSALLLGDVVKPTQNDTSYEMKTLASTEPLIASTDSSGRLWLFTGVDSAFEITTILYYTQVRVSLQAR